MIIPLGEKVLAIEHFEFDASSFSRKGSMDKRKLAERNRDFDKIIDNSDIDEGPVVIANAVNCTYSSDNYIKNFRLVFENHLAKIEEYKNNLVKMNRAKCVDDVIICFFIVDTTPLGCYYLEDGMESYVLIQVPECLDIISESKAVDCLMLGYYDGKDYSLEFICNCLETVECIKKLKIIDFKTDEFFCFDPQETRFCAKLNK